MWSLLCSRERDCMTLPERRGGTLLQIKGYFDLGNLYYDTLFGLAPELQYLFTRERSEMGVKVRGRAFSSCGAAFRFDMWKVVE